MNGEVDISHNRRATGPDHRLRTADYPGGHRGMLAAMRQWRQDGRSFCICLVVLTQGSTYRKAGALAAIVSRDGARRGVISGGCLEPDLVRAAISTLGAEAPTVLVFDTQGDDDVVFGSGSGCRGRMSILLAPVMAGAASPLFDALQEADERRLPLKIGLALEGPWQSHGWCWCGSRDDAIGTGLPELLPLRHQAAGEHRLLLNGSETACAVLTVHYAPRAVLVGAGPELPPLLRIGRELGWHATVIDHRAAAVFRYAWEADRSIVARPAVGLARLPPQPNDAVVILTHTVANDLEALVALSSRTERYVGLLGPPARRDDLMRQLGPAHRASLAKRLHSPAGLNLLGDGPEVLALSIAAELQQYFATAV